MNPELLGVILAVIGAIFYSVNVLLMRKATTTGRPLDGVMVILWIGTLFYIPLTLILYYPSLGLTKISIGAFIFSGIIGMFLGRTSYYEGTKRVGASRTVVIARGQLLVASFVSIIFLNESISTGHFIGMLILLIGIGAISYEVKSDTGSQKNSKYLDLLFPVFTMILWGFSLPTIKFGLSKGTPPVVGLSIQFTTALIAMSGYFIAKGDSPIQPFKLNEKYYYIAAGLVYSVGMIFIYSALSLSRTVVIAPFRSLTPFFTIILSYIFIRKLEKFTKILIIGSILTVLGSALVAVLM